MIIEEKIGKLAWYVKGLRNKYHLAKADKTILYTETKIEDIISGIEGVLVAIVADLWEHSIGEESEFLFSIKGKKE